MPTKNHVIRKKASFKILYISSLPSNSLFTAIEERSTIIKTANISSTINTPNTIVVNCCFRIFKSVNALMIIVVDDIDNIPPKKILSKYVKCNKRPAAYPNNIIPTTITNAVITAEPPTLTNFRKLNSNPKENSKTIIPISAQISILAISVTVGKNEKCGPARKPVTI